MISTSGLFAQQTHVGSDGVEVTISDLSRIVAIGSAVTETIFALDAHDKVVAVDESSLYPDEAAALPKVPFTRNISAEGILSMNPTIVLASDAAGPATAVQQIRSTGTALLKVTADETVDGAFERVEQLCKILDREAEAESIINQMRKELEIAKKNRSNLSELPKVLFIYARGANNLTVAGNRTSAKTMIELSGGVNAFDNFDGYKPLTPEAVVTANPDIILMMDSGIESVGGVDGVLKAPGVNLTEAAKQGSIYSMDGNYLLGFGPRMGQAVLALMGYLHPDIQTSLSE
ncbi:MAG: helical backbone metal receptor [Balneolales bacterium]